MLLTGRRAAPQVLVDSYVTGMERGILEGSLFGVVPVVATSGQAQDMVDVPIPQVRAEPRPPMHGLGRRGPLARC